MHIWALFSDERLIDKASKNGKKFSPQFPVVCPYVTAVGATQIQNGSSVNDPEVACNQVIYSGGGWSQYVRIDWMIS